MSSEKTAMSENRLRELAFKGWWARLATGELGRRYDTYSVLVIAELAFDAGSETALAAVPASGAGEQAIAGVHGNATCEQMEADYKAVSEYVARIKKLLHLPDNYVLGVSVDSIRDKIRDEVRRELQDEHAQAIAQARVEEHMAFHGCDHTKTGKWLGFNCEWLAKMRAAAEGEKRG
jgi:hypothetical protein